MTTTFGFPEPLGSAEGEPDPLGVGAFDGAGAYVQPASADVQAATKTRDSKATDIGRARRMGVGTFQRRKSD